MMQLQDDDESKDENKKMQTSSVVVPPTMIGRSSSDEVVSSSSSQKNKLVLNKQKSFFSTSKRVLQRIQSERHCAHGNSNTNSGEVSIKDIPLLKSLQKLSPFCHHHEQELNNINNDVNDPRHDIVTTSNSSHHYHSFAFKSILKKHQHTPTTKIERMIQKRQWEKLKGFLQTTKGLEYVREAWNSYEANVRRITTSKCHDGDHSTHHLKNGLETKQSTLSCSEESADVKATSFDRSVLPSNSTLLHLICKNHPPVEIIQDIMNECPFDPIVVMENNLNKHKHAPLHVAAAWGANPLVIEYLLQHAPHVASWVDVHGRTPLHLHCKYCYGIHNSCDPSSFTRSQHKSYRRQRRQEDDELDDLVAFEEEHEQYVFNTSPSNSDHAYESNMFGLDSLLKNRDNNDRSKSSLLQDDMNICPSFQYDTTVLITFGPVWDVVQSLYNAYPDSIHNDDEYGMNPIEYCLVSDDLDHLVSHDILIKMQRLSVQQWRCSSSRTYDVCSSRTLEPTASQDIENAASSTKDVSRNQNVTLSPRNENVTLSPKRQKSSLRRSLSCEDLQSFSKRVSIKFQKGPSCMP